MSDTLQADALGRILDSGVRPKRASWFSATTTLAWRAMLKIKHVPFQLFDVTATPIMFTLLFTFLFGGAIAGSPKAYVQDLLPGILVQTIVFITVYTGVGLNADIQKGLFDRFRSLPIWQPAPVFGALLGDLFRYTVAATIVVLVGLALGFRSDNGFAAGLLGIVLALLLTLAFAFSLSWIWIIVGLRAKTPESVMTASFLFLFPLTFVSNIFVPEETMPNWLRTVVGFNPVTHLADAARELMHGYAPAGEDLAWTLGAAGLVTLVFAPIAFRLYRKER